MERTLDVNLKLIDEEHFSVTITDNESGFFAEFDQDTSSIEEKIGVEIMSWLDYMDSEEE